MAGGVQDWSLVAVGFLCYFLGVAPSFMGPVRARATPSLPRAPPQRRRRVAPGARLQCTLVFATALVT